MILTLLLTGLLSFAQTEAVSDSTLTFDTTKTVIVNADYAKQPVKSMRRSGAGVVDTLNTLNEFIKVVLCYRYCAETTARHAISPKGYRSERYTTALT